LRLVRDGSDLVRAAQAGDAGALGLLLGQHEAGMRAVALSILGYGPEAEDAVQDAMVTALRRIGDVRDPSAVGAWLRTVVRNNCRVRLRGTQPVPVDSTFLDSIGGGPAPEELLERSALRDWVWHALDELSEADRQVMLLRHFTGVTSYEQIAAICGIPVGTVRSRLSHGRRVLTERLRAGAEAAHADAGELAAASRRQAEDALAAAMRGDFHRVVGDLWHADAEMRLRDRVVGGTDAAIRGMAGDLSAGVRQRLVNVVAGPGVLIWETDLISPPDDPDHCPPGAVWLHKLHEGRVSKLTLFHP
jgi:RNA polymerase sigma factor (sigma-70 family)